MQGDDNLQPLFVQARAVFGDVLGYIYIYIHDQRCDSGCSVLRFTKSSVQLAIGPQPHLALSSAWASMRKIRLTPPSAAKIHVFHTELSNRKLEIIMGLMSLESHEEWLTIEWLPL